VTRRILFLVDHKHRDLPSLVLIGCHLESLGFESHYVGLGNEVEVIARVDPEFIVLPKPIYDYERLLRWKIDGRRLIVIETEGNPQDLEYRLRIRVPPDLHLFWNESIAQRYRNQLERAGTVVRVVGFPRSDFLHERLDGVFPSREELLVRYGLDPDHRTLTIATSGQDAHFSEQRLKDKRKRRSRSFERTADYLEIVANMRELRDKTTDFVQKLLDRFPDLNIALKPHPHESAVFWSDFIESLGRPNIALVIGEPINHLLRVSDFHVSYNVCTTTVEALLTGLPVAEIHTRRSSALYAERHLSLSTYRVMDFTELAEVVSAELYATSPRHESSSETKNLDSYVSDFLFAFDGRRCEAYAQSIAEWASANGGAALTGMAYLLANPKLAAMYLALRVRSAVRRAVTARQIQKADALNTQINRPTHDNDRPVREIKGTLVDEEFGLYDNRMRTGDEAVWIEKYRRACIVSEPA